MGGGQAQPRPRGVLGLLAEIGALRTSLSVDLSLLAAAVDAGAEGLAGELVDGDLAQVRGLGQGRATP